MPAVYDTHYLALADILGCDLWTADERFFNSVKEQQPRVKWLGEFKAGR
jgi:predicted nucleic acid-binding protein